MKRRAIFIPLVLLIMALIAAGCSSSAEQATEEPEPAEEMMDEGEAMDGSEEEPMDAAAVSTGADEESMDESAEETMKEAEPMVEATEEEMMESEASILSE